MLPSLEDLEPLFQLPAGSAHARKWHPSLLAHRPFIRWLLVTSAPRRLSGKGAGVDEIQTLARQAGLTVETAHIADIADGAIELLLLDTRLDDDEAWPAHWQPRLAPGAVVLIQGVHSGGAGALLWRRWREEAAGAPFPSTLLLPAGPGLGLILHEVPGATGRRPAPALRALCAAPPEALRAFERACLALGAHEEALRGEAEAQMKAIEARRRLQVLLAQAQRQRNVSRAESAVLRAEAQARIGAVQHQLELSHAALANERQRADALAHALAGIEASNTWRAARVAQRLGARLPPRVRVALRRAARLAWWTLTGKLGHAWRNRRERQREAAERAQHPEVPGAPPPATEMPEVQPTRGVPDGPTEAERIAMQRRRLGLDLPATTLRPVTLGFAVGHVPVARLRRAVRAAQRALSMLGQGDEAQLTLVDDGFPVEPVDVFDTAVVWLPRRGVPGWAAAHNRMMQLAFAGGAEVYVAADPRCVFEVDAVSALMRVLRASGREPMALVEPTPGPADAKPVDAEDAVPWCSPWGLAIPRGLYQRIGGFDLRLDAQAAAVDLSLRARVAGATLMRSPHALCRTSDGDAGFENLRAAPMTAAAHAAAWTLARKWGADALATEIAGEPGAVGLVLPEVPAVDDGAAALGHEGLQQLLSAWWRRRAAFDLPVAAQQEDEAVA